MLRKNKYNYFNELVKLSDYCSLSAKLLVETMESFKIGKLNTKIKEMQEIGRSADIQGNKIIERLSADFITPLEREDILALVHKINEITHSIEDILLYIYMCNIKKIRIEALEIVEIIIKSCGIFKRLLEEFHNFRKSNEIRKYIIEIKKLGKEARGLYLGGMRRLYTMSKDPLEIISWTGVFKGLEKSSNKLGQAANLIESIIVKNL